MAKTQLEIELATQRAFDTEAVLLTGRSDATFFGIVVTVWRRVLGAVLKAFYDDLDKTDGYQAAGTERWFLETIAALFVSGYGIVGKSNIRVVDNWQGGGTMAVVLVNQIGASNFPAGLTGAELSINQAILSAIRSFVKEQATAGVSTNVTVANRLDATFAVKYRIRLATTGNQSQVETAIQTAVSLYLSSVTTGRVVLARLEAIPDEVAGVQDWSLVTPDPAAQLDELTAFAYLVPTVTFEYF